MPVLHTCEELVLNFHKCEESVPNAHRCEKMVPNAHICEILYHIIKDVKNWYLIFTFVNDRICNI